MRDTRKGATANDFSSANSRLGPASAFDLHDNRTRNVARAAQASSPPIRFFFA
jgi:hypothetical protein